METQTDDYFTHSKNKTRQNAALMQLIKRPSKRISTTLSNKSSTARSICVSFGFGPVQDAARQTYSSLSAERFRYPSATRVSEGNDLHINNMEMSKRLKIMITMSPSRIAFVAVEGERSPRTTNPARAGRLR